MDRQRRELDSNDATLAQMGQDHAQWGGSARVALTRGSESYKRAFAEQAYAQMQTSALWSEAAKDAIRAALNFGYVNAALEVIANANGED